MEHALLFIIPITRSNLDFIDEIKLINIITLLHIL